MSDLVARLEKATGPDRDIDELIAEAVGYKVCSETQAYGRSWNSPSGYFIGAAPKFTDSLDAAVTLIPEGWAWSVHVGGCYATGRLLKPRAELAEAVETQFGPAVGIRSQIEAATPAIAICIAALKARAAQSAPHPNPGCHEGEGGR